LLVAFLTSASPVPARQKAATPAPGSIESYRIIFQRNIFDPNRSASRAAPQVDKAVPPPPPPPPEWIDLTGVLMTAGGAVAFFEGSSRAGTGARGVGAEIGGMKIKNITPDEVILLAGQKTSNVRVGGRLERRNDAPWTLVGEAPRKPAGAPPRSVATGSASETMAPNNSGTSAAPAPSSGKGPPADLLKKLLERRKRELAQ